MQADLFYSPRSAENPLKSSHTLPERIYSVTYTPQTSKILVSMAHRHVWVFDAASLSSAMDGQPLKPEQQRESALKLLTRSIAIMADGKGRWSRSFHLSCLGD